MNISIAMIVGNAERTIDVVLKSLLPFSNVVLFGNNSTDNTEQISQKYPNVTWIKGDFTGFGPTKNKAAEFAIYDWILSIDSDEVLDSRLISSLANLNLNDCNNVYAIIRHNYYKNRRIKYCGWGAEKIIRLYNRKATKFNNKLVHESVISHGLQIKTLSGTIKHYSFFAASDFIAKMNHYSNIFAKQNKLTKKTSPAKAFFRALAHFLKCYIFRLGFLDGYPGLLIAVSGANGVFYKYAKLYETQKFNP